MKITMKKLIPALAILFFILPSVSFATGLTTQQSTSLIAVVQSSPGTPASAFVSLITAFSNITTNQASSLIAVVQASPSTPANAFVNLLVSFTEDTSTTQPTTPATQTNQQTNQAVTQSQTQTPTSSRSTIPTPTQAIPSTTTVVTQTHPLPTIIFSKENSGTSGYQLKWNATNATSCAIRAIPSASVDGSGSTGTVVVTPQERTEYIISCTGSGGTSSSSITLDNRYTVLNKDNVSLSIQSIVSSFNLNTCMQEYHPCDSGIDLFKLALSLPNGSLSGSIYSLDVTLISELRDNYYLNQLRAKGFKEDRNAICTLQEQQSSQNAMCSSYFQIGQGVEYIDFTPIPNVPIIGNAIKKGVVFKFDTNLGGSFTPNEKLELIFNVQPNAATFTVGESGRIKLRVDKIRFRDEAYGEEVYLPTQPIESEWVQLSR